MTEASLPNEVRLTEQWMLPEALNPHRIVGDRRGNAYTRFTLISLARCFLDFADREFATDTGEAVARARGALHRRTRPARPTERALPPGRRRSARSAQPRPASPCGSTRRLNLAKIRDGRNFAGLRRQIDPPAARADGAGPLAAAGGSGALVAGAAPLQPTPYRYAVLIERAKQIVGIAQQIEAAFLAALEKQDAEATTCSRRGRTWA